MITNYFKMISPSVKNKKIENIFDVLKPFYYISRFVGAAPFTITKKGHLYEFKTKIIDYIILFFFTILEGYLFYICVFYEKLTVNSNSNITNIGSQLMMSSAILVTIFMAVINFIQRKGTVEIVQDLNRVDESMRLLNIELEHKMQSTHLVKYIFTCFILTIILIIINTILISFVSDKIWTHLPNHLTFILSNLFYSIFISQFILSIVSIYIRFKKLNEGFNEIFKLEKLSNDEDLSHIVVHISNVHDRLIEIVQKINIRYSFWTMIILAAVFCFATLSIFSFLRAIIYFELKTFLYCLTRFIWSMYYIAFITLVTAAGSRATREVLSTNGFYILWVFFYKSSFFLFRVRKQQFQFIVLLKYQQIIEQEMN